MKVINSAILAFLGATILAQPISVAETPQQRIAEIPQQRTITGQNGLIVQKGEKFASISLARTARGITEIGIGRLDSFPNTYVTMVTASGPTREDAANVGAAIKTFTNLNQQSSFADTKTITFTYNKIRPSYVISELERAKLISPVEAQAARTAFDSLQSRMESKPAPAESSR